MRSSICHGEYSRSVMTQFKVFVLESVAVDGFSSRTVMIREVTSLTHEILDDSMKCRSLKSETFLTCTKCSKILCRFRYYVRSQSHFDSTQRFVVRRHVEEHSLCTCVCVCV